MAKIMFQLSSRMISNIGRNLFELHFLDFQDDQNSDSRKRAKSLSKEVSRKKRRVLFETLVEVLAFLEKSEKIH